MIFRRTPYAPYDPTDLRMATPEEEREVEERYGKTIEELADEAEAGYDVEKLKKAKNRR